MLQPSTQLITIKGQVGFLARMALFRFLHTICESGAGFWTTNWCNRCNQCNQCNQCNRCSAFRHHKLFRTFSRAILISLTFKMADNLEEFVASPQVSLEEEKRQAVSISLFIDRFTDLNKPGTFWTKNAPDSKQYSFGFLSVSISTNLD